MSDGTDLTKGEKVVGPASQLLTEGVEESEARREECRQVIQDALDSGNPLHRLALIEAFVSRQHSDPLVSAIAELLAPILEIDFDDHVGTDHRKGAVAKKMCLSSGWPPKKTIQNRMFEDWVDMYSENKSVSKAAAREAAEKVLDKKASIVSRSERRRRNQKK